MDCLRWGAEMDGVEFTRRVATVRARVLVVLAFGAFGAIPSVAHAQQYASKQRTNAALGHYARARAMLVEALAEFEQGRKYARPDMLVDPEEWRLSVISRTEELNRLIDPKPRVTRGGVQFRANKMLIRRERDRLPAVADGAQDRNTYGEEQRRQELQNTRARLEGGAVPSGEAERAMANVRDLVRDALSEDAQAVDTNGGQPEQTEETPIGNDQGLIFGEDDTAVEAPPVAAKVPPTRGALGNAPTEAQPTPGEAATEAVEEEVGETAPVAPVARTGADPARDGAEGSENLDPKTAAVDAAIQQRLTQRDTPTTVGSEEVLEEDIDPEQ